MSKRKWKVYITDELRDRFKPKPGQPAPSDDDPQKIVVPNLKRRNSAPPGMIHFPPGTFTSNNQSAHPQNHNRSHSPLQPPSPPISTHQQHELVTHARSSPTLKPSAFPYPSRLEKRRASLPYIPPASTYNIPHSFPGMPAPSIEAYLPHFQNSSNHEVDMQEDESPPHTPPPQALPSFQSFLKTIREDTDEEDEEDNEIREIEERIQGSKSLPILKETKPTQPTHSPQIHTQYQPEPLSPSNKFYKNNISRSNDNINSLSRMSISDIIG